VDISSTLDGVVEALEVLSIVLFLCGAWLALDCALFHDDSQAERAWGPLRSPRQAGTSDPATGERQPLEPPIALNRASRDVDIRRRKTEGAAR